MIIAVRRESPRPVQSRYPHRQPACRAARRTPDAAAALPWRVMAAAPAAAEEGRIHRHTSTASTTPPLHFYTVTTTQLHLHHTFSTHYTTTTSPSYNQHTTTISPHHLHYTTTPLLLHNHTSIIQPPYLHYTNTSPPHHLRQWLTLRY